MRPKFLLFGQIVAALYKTGHQLIVGIAIVLRKYRGTVAEIDLVMCIVHGLTQITLDHLFVAFLIYYYG